MLTQHGGKHNTGSQAQTLEEVTKSIDEGRKTKARACRVDELLAIIINNLDPSPHEVEGLMEALYEGMNFVDDVSRFGHLDRAEVIKARMTEMQFFKIMRVYVKVPRSEVKTRGGKVITTKWVNTDKGDKGRPNYRSTLVGREIKTDKRQDLYVATPPLETAKFLVAKCAKGQSRRQPLRIAVVEVRRAYFYAKAQRPVYVEIPDKD